MISDRELWTAANMVLARHREAAPVFVAERIGQCALAGDPEGLEVWKAIAARLNELAQPTGCGKSH